MVPLSQCPQCPQCPTVETTTEFCDSARNYKEGSRATADHIGPSWLYQLELNQNITEHSADSIFLMDEQERITFANPEAQRVFGYTAAELLGQHLHQVIHHRCGDGCPSPTSLGRLETLSQSDRAVGGHEDCFFHKDGSVVHGVCSKAPLDVDGRRMGAVLVIHYRTEQNRVEEAQQQTQLRLITLVDSAVDGIITVDVDQ